MSSTSVRETLKELLGVRCVFPCVLLPNSQEIVSSQVTISSRCMLENGDKTFTYEESTEDVIAKLKYLSQNTGSVSTSKVRPF